VLLFNVPAFDSGAARGVYVGVMYTVASTAFSIYSVPYLTMGSELASTPHDRTVVMGWRQVGLGGGLVLGNALPMLLVSWGGGNESGFRFMGSILGVACGLTMFVTFLGTRSARLAEHEQPMVPLGAQFRLALKNRPFLLLVAGNFMQLVGSAAAYATIVLFTVYHLGKDYTFVSRMTLIMAIMVIVTPVFWTMAARRFGKRPTFMFSIVMFIGTYLAFLTTAPGGDGYVYFLCMMLGVFNCGFSLIAFSMLLDTIAYDTKLSGLNREGVYSGIWSAMDAVGGNRPAGNRLSRERRGVPSPIAGGRPRHRADLRVHPGGVRRDRGNSDAVLSVVREGFVRRDLNRRDRAPPVYRR
jgi:GPH family glycoside/pentoside/hexuronide:cation symporter